MTLVGVDGGLCVFVFGSSTAGNLVLLLDSILTTF